MENREQEKRKIERKRGKNRERGKKTTRRNREEDGKKAK